MSRLIFGLSFVLSYSLVVLASAFAQNINTQDNPNIFVGLHVAQYSYSSNQDSTDTNQQNSEVLQVAESIALEKCKKAIFNKCLVITKDYNDSSLGYSIGYQDFRIVAATVVVQGSASTWKPRERKE